MSGPQDPSDEVSDAYGCARDLGGWPDSRPGQADRPARGSLTDLRQRLERLPTGHPSSPYDDDGSRKPPAARLKDLELPLPGETDAAEPDADVDTAERVWTDADRAGTDRTEASRTEASRTEASRTEASRTETSRTEASRTETSRTETGRPETRATETDRPAAGWPGIEPNAPGIQEDRAGWTAREQPWSGPDGSWEWKGRRLTPSQCKIADDTLSRSRAAEGRTVFGAYGDAGLTPVMRRIEAQLEHGRLVPETEKLALKSSDRFKEKLAKLIADEPGAEPADLAVDIPDAVRYTYLFADEHYLDGVWQIHERLGDQGYELQVRRNSWENQEYKGTNSRWRDLASGQLFEVQFHTDQSWAAKQQTHEAYEGIASARTSTSERERLRAYQREVSASVPAPRGAIEIPDYRKDD
jgi:hypothetical protein